MFVRRLNEGQCWHQPYLGTREFSCDFFPVTQENHANELNLTYPMVACCSISGMIKTIKQNLSTYYKYCCYVIVH